MLGRFGMSLERSAIYHNPYATYTIPESIFQMVRQYYSGETVSPSAHFVAKASKGWLWL